MKPTFLPTLIPFTKEAQAVLALSPESYDGYWARKSPWISQTGEVFDQRLDLGDPRPAQPRRATEWNGTNQYAWIPIDPVTEFPFTLFGWARKSDTTLETIVGISASSVSTKLFVVQADEGDRLAISRRNPTTVTTETSISPKTNTWSSFVISFTSNTTCQLFRDGELVANLSGLAAVNVDSSFNRVVIGATNSVSPEGYWTGPSMHCGFLRRAATLADAQAFHATGEIPDAEVLLPLDNSSTTVTYNIGSSAAHWLDEPRRNLAQYTEDALNGYWRTLQATVLPSAEIPPPGISAAFRVQETAVSSEHRWENNTAAFSVQSGTAYTITLFAKAQERTRLRIGFDNFANIPGRAFFDLSAGTVYNTAAGTTASIENIGNGWYRCRVTATAISTVTTRLEVALVNTETTVIYLGDTANGLLLTAPQVELGSTATEYQPVLRTGIDYPEATIVNGAAGMLYTGRDVPFSRQNKVGYSPRRNLITFTEDASNAAWSFVNVSGTATRVGNNITFGSSAIDRILSSTLTIAANTQMTASFTLSGSGQVRLFLVDGTGLTQSPGNITLTPTPTRYTATFTLVNAGSQARCAVYNDSSGLPAAFTIHNAQLELGPAATPYQRIGADPGANVRFPALLSDPTKSAATDPLTFSGEVPRNAQLEQANCFTFDDSDDRVAVDLSQWAGPELVTNGTFDVDANWTKESGWVISGGIATRTNISDTSDVTQPISLTAGKSYLVSFTLTSVSSGGLLARFGGGTTVSGVIRNSPGVYTEVLTAVNGNNLLRMVGSSTFAGSIDNVSVRELPTGALGPELVVNGGFDTDTVWIKGTGWTISGGSANAVGSNLVLSQNSLFTSGRAYRITFTQTFTSGSLQVRIAGTQSLGFFNTSGTHVINFVATATGALEFNGTALTTSIDNVSVVQIGLIPHDGTSLLTYRSQGDGFTGTAGTAFNIRIGDVEHIPCSEGAGNKLHGTKLNQEYLVVNGQASNWTTKQNTYHYNTAEGYSDALSDDAKIATLFAAGEQGTWYDANDRSTMFQDPFGGVPITASGQTVGLQLDKSKGLIAGPNIRSNGVVGLAGTATAATYNTSTGEGQCTRVDIPNQSFVQFNGLVPDSFYRITVNVTGGVPVVLRTRAHGGAFNFTHPVGQITTGIARTDNIGQLTLTCTITGTATFTLVDLHHLPGNHRYQGVLASRPQYVKVGNLAKLVYGSNRFFETNAVDFTGTNKMTVWWGGRKLADTNLSILIESSSTVSSNVGAIALSYGASPWRYRWTSKGTSEGTTGTTGLAFNAPITNVLTGIGDIEGDLARLRINGVQIADSVADQGTGNYGNHKFYFGMRAGTSLSAEIEETVVIIRGAQTTANMIEIVENIVADKVGLAEFHANPTPPTADFDVRLPASQTNPGFDVLGNPLTNPPVVGLNGAESRINFSPVANSWPTGISIPGADIPTYEFDGNPGDIQLGINSEKREASFHLRND